MPVLHLSASFAASLSGACACVCVQGMASPLRDLSTQLTFKVTGSPAVLSQAVRGYLRA